MKKSVILIQSPVCYKDSPPFGLASLKAYLKKDFDVKIKDYNIEFSNKTIYPLVKFIEFINDMYYLTEQKKLRLFLFFLKPTIKKIVDDILSEKPDVIGFSSIRSSLLTSLAISKELKKRSSVPIVFGGPSCIRENLGFSIIKNPSVNYVVLQEGEEISRQLFTDIDKSNKQHIKGILYKKNGKVIDTGDYPSAIKMDALPTPDYSDFDLDNYLERRVPFSFSRGCTKHCSFCCDQTYWKHYRYKNPKKTVDEIEEIMKRYNVHAFFLADSLANGSPKQLESICDKLIERNLSIKWKGMARADPTLTPQLLKKIKKSGCESFSFGIESGSQKVSNHMNKNLTIETTEEVLENVSKAGIRVGVNILVGFPTETLKDYFKSIRYVWRNIKSIDFCLTYALTLSSDSLLNKNLEEYGIYKQNTLLWKSKHSTFLTRQIKLYFLRLQLPFAFLYRKIRFAKYLKNK